MASNPPQDVILAVAFLNLNPTGMLDQETLNALSIESPNAVPTSINIDSWTNSDVLNAKTSQFLLGYKNITANESKEDNFKKDLVDFMKGYGKKDEFFSSNQDKTKLLDWLSKAANGTLQPLSSYDSAVIIAKKNLGKLGYNNLFLFDEYSNFLSTEYNNDIQSFVSSYGLNDRYVAMNYDKPSLYDWIQQAVSQNLDQVTKDYTNWGEIIKSNGQVLATRQDGTEIFTNYGGIANTDEFVKATWGDNFTLNSNKTISGISNVTQDVLESNAGNCTLAAITKVLKYFGDHCGCINIPPSLKNIYKIVRDIGVQNGYEPNGSGIWYDLVTYGSYKIDNMVQEAWASFDYSTGSGSNSFPNIYTFDDIKSSIDDSRPLLLSMSNGDYPGHTVTVVGYKEYTCNDGLYDDARYIEIYDNWSDEYRYIDWTLFWGNCVFSVLTSFIPPTL